MIKAGRLSEILCRILTARNMMLIKCAIECNYTKLKHTVYNKRFYSLNKCGYSASLIILSSLVTLLRLKS